MQARGGGGKRSDLLSLATGHFFFPDDLSLPSRRPSLIPFIHYSERAQQTVPQLPNPFPAPSSPDFGRLLQLRAPPPHLSGELGIRGRYGANRMVFQIPRVFLRILQLSVSRVRPERLLAAVRRRGMAAAAGRLVPAGFVLGI